MAFFPKNKISKPSFTDNGDLKVKMYPKNAFIGNYIKTSNGKYFEYINGELGRELIYNAEGFSKTVKSAKNVIGFTPQDDLFSNRHKGTKSFLQSTLPIPVSKPKPTEEDYKKGYFTRYYSKRINQKYYKEIDKDTYKSLKSEDGTFDHNINTAGKIKWNLTGNDAHQQNSIRILKTNNLRENLINLFPNPVEYHRINPDTPPTEELHTDGGELYYEDGSEYIGAYHIHPLKGPMEGATHSDEPHANLYYTNQLPETGEMSYSDFQSNYDKIDCYSCKYIQGEPVIFTIQGFRTIGCPQNAFEDYMKAINACPASQLTEAEEIPDRNIPNYNNENIGGNETSGGGEGGTSGGGGGGY
jgi:hypothetical protein